MSKELHVAIGPLTGAILCGSVSNSGEKWLSNKTDVTGEACVAVARHVLLQGGGTVVSADGVPIYEINVKELPCPE
jgi:hypothetical protein